MSAVPDNAKQRRRGEYRQRTQSTSRADVQWIGVLGRALLPGRTLGCTARGAAGAGLQCRLYRQMIWGENFHRLIK